MRRIFQYYPSTLHRSSESSHSHTLQSDSLAPNPYKSNPAIDRLPLFLVYRNQTSWFSSKPTCHTSQSSCPLPLISAIYTDDTCRQKLSYVRCSFHQLLVLLSKQFALFGSIAYSNLKSIQMQPLPHSIVYHCCNTECELNQKLFFFFHSLHFCLWPSYFTSHPFHHYGPPMVNG